MPVLNSSTVDRPLKALGLMNVDLLLPPHLHHYAHIYKTRSWMLPTTHADLDNADKDFLTFVHKHSGVKKPLGNEANLKLFKYAPDTAVHSWLRNKSYTKRAVMQGKVKGVSLPPNTRIFKAGNLLREYARPTNLPNIPTVYQLDKGDGGYGTLMYFPGKTPVQNVYSMLKKVPAETDIIVANFATNLTHTVGVPITANGISIFPNANMSFTGEADTVGVSAPMIDVLNHAKWVNAAMRASVGVREFIMSHWFWDFTTMNVDLGITNHGSTDTLFFEINPRMTMSHLVTSGIWKVCLHKGTTKLDYITFLQYMNAGRLGLGYIAVDKIDCGDRSFSEITKCLAHARITPFDGHNGWLPTRQQYNGQIGLILISQHTDTRVALKTTKKMYLAALKALDTKTKGELDKLGI